MFRSTSFGAAQQGGMNSGQRKSPAKTAGLSVQHIQQEGG
jgi:hypothetical protein